MYIVTRDHSAALCVLSPLIDPALCRQTLTILATSGNLVSGLVERVEDATQRRLWEQLLSPGGLSRSTTFIKAALYAVAPTADRPGQAGGARRFRRTSGARHAYFV
jgi:hypothetical protein